MSESIIADKSTCFALNIIKLYKDLIFSRKEYVLSKQILRSGTAIGALVSESKFAQSEPDFIHKLSIALKEANETLYWLTLLHKSDFMKTETFDLLQKECNEIISILVSIIKTMKSKQISKKSKPTPNSYLLILIS